MVVAAASAIAGCSGRKMAPVGFSPERAVEPAPRGQDSGAVARPVSPVAPDFRSRMAKLTGRFTSEGHAERFDAIVWANGSARRAWTAHGVVEDGGMFIEELTDRCCQGDRAGGLLVMEKDGGGWRFTVVGSAGEVVTDARVAACAACHHDAPRDGVFVLR
jgi:hypothetical protein